MSSNLSDQVTPFEGQAPYVPTQSAPPGWEGHRGAEIGSGSIAPALTANPSASLGQKPWENLPQGLSNMSLRAAQSQSRGALTRSFPNVQTFNPNGQGGFPPSSSFGNAPYNPAGPYADIRGSDAGPTRYALNSGSLNSSPAITLPRSGLSQSATGLLPPGAIGSPIATGHGALTSSSGGLRSSNTGIMTGTSLRASGVHPIPVPVDSTVPTEYGVICLLKDNYGFVRCVDREEDIFFHCTSLIPSSPLTSEELHSFITSIRVGHEVSFHVVNDTRTSKLSAVNLSLLAKGSVVFTETIQEKVRGIILREISEHSDENDFGVVAYRTTEDTVEQLRFGPMDLDEPRVPLAPEDEVEFDIVYNRRLKGKCAAHVVLMRFGGDRQTGIIHSVKDGFGFIRCCDSPRSLYFHFRDVVLLQRGQEISKGAEVEYTVANDERAGKLCAVRVRGLPKGTVSFTVQYDERQRGTVQRELSPNFPTPMGASPFTRREDEEKGVITFTTAEGTDSLLFGLSDIRNYQTMGRPFPYLKYGDEVECTVFIDKRNGRKHASDVTLVAAVTEKVEMGVVCSVKKNYGHITCAEQDEDLFFHFTDFDDSNLLESLSTGEKDIHPGMEVQFIIVPDSRTGKKKAAHIHLLNSGTVKFEDVSDARHQGVVIRESKPGQTGYTGKRQPSDLGMIEYESNTSSGKKTETVTFGCNDVKDTKLALWPGDVVAFHIATDKRTKTRSAVNVELVTPTQLPREVGVVSSVKNSFGFIKCTDRDEEVYFHFSEVQHPEPVTPGMELEFSVVKNSWFKKLLAIRIKPLSKGSVKFPVKVLEGRHTGTVDRELRGRGREGYGGKISYHPEGSEELSSLIDFNGDDVDARYTLRKGDRVQFGIVEDPRTKNLRATNIVPHTESGVVCTTKENFGFIKLAASQEEIFFHQSEVGGGVSLTPGDTVEFHTVVNPRTRTLSAQGIRKSGQGISMSSPGVQFNRNNSPSLGNSLNNVPTQSSTGQSGGLRNSGSGLRSSSEAFTPKSRSRMQRPPGSASPDVFVLRQPTPADGGKGFQQGAGRGKLTNKDRDAMVHQVISTMNDQQGSTTTNENK